MRVVQDITKTSSNPANRLPSRFCVDTREYEVRSTSSEDLYPFLLIFGLCKPFAAYTLCGMGASHYSSRYMRLERPAL